MQVFSVGGAVRDELLGRPVQDRDYVVIGATPAAMLELGFKPIGKDFPVFLHPQTHEEYALARTERKSGHGYKGFTFYCAPEVTLQEDLARRDLTINAIARSADGVLIDPYQGVADLKAQILRHVSPAFSEDPVRILRIARFAARFEHFVVAPETMRLMCQLVSQGEIAHLVAERVWQELAKGLLETRPSRMFEVLHACGALRHLWPALPFASEQYGAVANALLGVLDQLDQRGESLAVRFALLSAYSFRAFKVDDSAAGKAEHSGGVHDDEQLFYAQPVRSVEALCARLKVPVHCRDLAVLTLRCQENGLLLQRYLDQGRSTAELSELIVALLEQTDALRRPQRFAQWLAVYAAHRQVRAVLAGTTDSAPDLQATHLLTQALAVIRGLDTASIVRNSPDAGKIPEHLHAARIDALRKMLS
ncbi:MAG: multifunctional CCA tRNA nucleotidyl transferase/2'3'-cyclic phosphodiesterase/2'nucleotidase/phosphatase [Pseudomonadota bacterium]